ncbi:MAG: hypothetical protein F4213_10250 [Boseongicola sp. SB0677_bin_26]|nr:hypothetical protein [Boseongicola sp. SB0665_bin_10]MYG26389.1 hypothetical protein [Boseongicola sp. SB0677_bin_26]
MNAPFVTRSAGDRKGILGRGERLLVSCDFQHDPRSAAVNGPSTKVINGSRAKVHSWHDKEWTHPTFMAIRNMAPSAKGS